MSSAFRSGFVGILGRPNVGKSTLLNRVCGEKLAITSPKPQTTRTRVLGVIHRPGAQVVFLDTPGLHDSGRALGRSMKDVVAKVASDVDVILLMVDAARGHGQEDELALKTVLRNPGIPCLLIVNKVDAAGTQAALKRAEALEKEHGFSGTFLISALTGGGTSGLVDRIIELLPEGVPYFPEGMVTDLPLSFRLAEIVREKLFDRTREEIPYSTAVVVEEVAEVREDLLHVFCSVFVEKESQKGIVIGKGGKMLKEVGTAARPEMEALLGKKVFLEIRVKVKKDWPDREALLRLMGYR